jgi:hypothetical protein
MPDRLLGRRDPKTTVVNSGQADISPRDPESVSTREDFSFLDRDLSGSLEARQQMDSGSHKLRLFVRNDRGIVRRFEKRTQANMNCRQ